jgi:hypothetical protein
MISCVSTKVSGRNDYDYSRLKPNSEYIVKTKTGKVFRQFKFKEETDNSIVGIYKKEEMEIEKDDIIKINKFSGAKTFPLIFVTGAAAGIALIAAALSGSDPLYELKKH